MGELNAMFGNAKTILKVSVYASALTMDKR